MDTLLVYVYVFPPHSARVIEATDTCRPHSVQRSILQPALNGTSAIVPGISAQLDSFSFSGAIVHNSLPTSSHDLYRNFSTRSPSAPAMPVGNRPLVLDPYMESMALAVPRVPISVSFSLSRIALQSLRDFPVPLCQRELEAPF